MATDSVRTEVDFLQIDKFSRTPIYEQVIDGIEREILTGELKPNSPVASVRALSVQFSVNPNTLQKAYTELERRGLCYSVRQREVRFAGRNAAIARSTQQTS